MSSFRGTITLTFGDRAENHAGMQCVGEMVSSGLQVSELREAYEKLVKLGATCHLYDLNANLPAGVEGDPASVLVVKDGLKYFIGSSSEDGEEEEEEQEDNKFLADQMLKEQLGLEWDTKAKMKGRVVNKHARHNLCYSDFEQKPDYEKGKGTVVCFDRLPMLTKLRAGLPRFLGKKTERLQAEGNKYYDLEKCYIGFHGDGERKIVVAVRLGATMPLYYQWYQNSAKIGKLFKMEVGHGDVYVMSEKATGQDWLKKLKPTLRHAAGDERVLKM